MLVDRDHEYSKFDEFVNAIMAEVESVGAGAAK